jgi:hypothetical protein
MDEGELSKQPVVLGEVAAQRRVGIDLALRLVMSDVPVAKHLLGLRGEAQRRKVAGAFRAGTDKTLGIFAQ